MPHQLSGSGNSIDSAINGNILFCHVTYLGKIFIVIQIVCQIPECTCPTVLNYIGINRLQQSNLRQSTSCNHRADFILIICIQNPCKIDIIINCIFQGCNQWIIIRNRIPVKSQPHNADALSCLRCLRFCCSGRVRCLGRI